MTSQGPWLAFRALTADRSVIATKVGKETKHRIFTYALPFKRQIVFFLIVVVIEATLVVSQPLLFKLIVDEGIANADRRVVILGALGVALIALFSSIISMVERWFSAQIGEGLIFNLRSQIFDNVMQQSVAFFTRAQTGSLVSRLNSDVIGAQQTFTSTLSGVISNSISTTIVIGTMAFLSWQLTLASLILLPIFLYPAKWVGKKLQGFTRSQMSNNAELSQQMNERFNVSGALLSMLYANRKRELAAFEQRADEVRDAGIKIALINRFFFISLTLIGAIATAIIYGFGGLEVIDGDLSIGTLLALVALLFRLYGPLTALSNVRVEIMTALVAFDRVFEVLDLKPIVADPVNPIEIPTGPITLKFENVSFTYPKPEDVSLASLESIAAVADRAISDQVLHDISFEVKPGQMTALVGPSGAGKSTLSSLIPRLYDVTTGSVKLNNVDVRNAKLTDLRSKIGVVPQDPHMLHTTILENLTLGNEQITQNQIWEALDAAQISQLVKSLPNQLKTVVGDRGYRLSGGEKQRLAIARLLLKQPEIVILDEATAHLDSESEALVQQALEFALSNRTSIVIAHRLSTIRKADLVLVMAQGRIVQRGTHESLIAESGLYRDLHDKQFQE
ncbi:MAG: ABC transporter ATP-binding protein [Actinobacteria bacterium]|nr:ABC transporter ATP-binding protein [Actinomycetota bacterium]